MLMKFKQRRSRCAQQHQRQKPVLAVSGSAAWESRVWRGTDSAAFRTTNRFSRDEKNQRRRADIER